MGKRGDYTRTPEIREAKRRQMKAYWASRKGGYIFRIEHLEKSSPQEVKDVGSREPDDAEPQRLVLRHEATER